VSAGPGGPRSHLPAPWGFRMFLSNSFPVSDREETQKDPRPGSGSRPG
jgi:hypothetical protein